MSCAIEEILALETMVWEALKSGDAFLDERMLADEFLGVYPSGFSKKQEHCDQLKYGPTVASYQLADPHLLALTDDLVLLSYVARCSRVINGKPQKAEEMYISSLWKRAGGEWRNLFSQDTPAAR